MTSTSDLGVAYRHAADHFRATIGRTCDDGTPYPADVYESLCEGAGATPDVDVSRLIDATLTAADTGDGCCGTECIQALWTWHAAVGDAAVLALLERLAGPAAGLSAVTRSIATDDYRTFALHACGCVSEEPADQEAWVPIATCDDHRATWVGTPDA